jgi:hypothetical protein
MATTPARMTATAAAMTRKDELQRVKTIRQNLLLGIKVYYKY